jgi:hypothetical protein
LLSYREGLGSIIDKDDAVVEQTDYNPGENRFSINRNEKLSVSNKLVSKVS